MKDSFNNASDMPVMLSTPPPKDSLSQTDTLLKDESPAPFLPPVDTLQKASPAPVAKTSQLLLQNWLQSTSIPKQKSKVSSTQSSSFTSQPVTSSPILPTIKEELPVSTTNFNRRINTNANSSSSISKGKTKVTNVSLEQETGTQVTIDNVVVKAEQTTSRRLLRFKSFKIRVNADDSDVESKLYVSDGNAEDGDSNTEDDDDNADDGDGNVEYDVDDTGDRDDDAEDDDDFEIQSIFMNVDDKIESHCKPEDDLFNGESSDQALNKGISV